MSLQGFGFLVGAQKNPQEKIYSVGGVEHNIIISFMLGTPREASSRDRFTQRNSNRVLPPLQTGTSSLSINN
jgi:hypothetical protein